MTVFLVILAFMIGFGAVMAARLDTSAISAVLGAVCALAFGVPATIIATIVLLRYRQSQNQKQEQWRPSMPQPQPPVVIVPPAQYPQLGFGGYGAPWQNDELLSAPISRQFTVVGEEDADDR